MVGDLLLQRGPKRQTEECTIQNWAVTWGAVASFSAIELVLAEGEAKRWALHYPCRRVDHACWHLTLWFMEGIKCECHCLD